MHAVFTALLSLALMLAICAAVTAIVTHILSWVFILEQAFSEERYWGSLILISLAAGVGLAAIGIGVYRLFDLRTLAVICLFGGAIAQLLGLGVLALLAIKRWQLFRNYVYALLSSAIYLAILPGTVQLIAETL